MKNLVLLSFLLVFVIEITAQTEDTGKFRTYPAGFYHKVIMRDILGDDNYSLSDYKPVPVFKMDFGEKIYPVQISEYTTIPHSEPVSQGNSGTCWAYSATSFMEAESYRITKNKTKLSEMFTVYWEYVERAQHFVRTKGETYLGEGSESNAIVRIMRNHGMMPQVVYHGLKNRLNYNDHSEMFEKYETYLNYVKANQMWEEDLVIDSIKRILDYYIGTPPDKFEYIDKEYTPQSFMTEYMKLNPNHYFSFMSTKEFNYNEKHELVENDNWWHSKDYYNISLEDFMIVLNNAVKNGYTVSLCGDVSEPGYDQLVEVAVIPSFDIPSQYINEDARQMRLSNNSTTDDHCIHIVGYKMEGDVVWYLIKDSGSGGFDGKNKGYRFYHEDYIKLKMMNLMMNVEPARIILDKIIK
ncbi:MAG TPA: C1 family peptidase [Bacteroidales bacterium]|nr:C1 family peptidase [Bacteroidales bacterium]